MAAVTARRAPAATTRASFKGACAFIEVCPGGKRGRTPCPPFMLQRSPRLSPRTAGRTGHDTTPPTAAATGVEPFLMPFSEAPEKTVQDALANLKRREWCKK